MTHLCGLFNLIMPAPYNDPAAATNPKRRALCRESNGRKGSLGHFELSSASGPLGSFMPDEMHVERERT